jgi:hypothetical protein
VISPDAVADAAGAAASSLLLMLLLLLAALLLLASMLLVVLLGVLSAPVLILGTRTKPPCISGTWDVSAPLQDGTAQHSTTHGQQYSMVQCIETCTTVWGMESSLDQLVSICTDEALYLAYALPRTLQATDPDAALPHKCNDVP